MKGRKPRGILNRTARLSRRLPWGKTVRDRSSRMSSRRCWWRRTGWRSRRLGLVSRLTSQQKTE